MTRERSVDERISVWLLENAPDQLPDRVLTATFERTAATRQRRPLLGRSLTPVRRNMGAALLAAAAIVLVLVAVNLLPRANPAIIGGPSQSPIVSPTAEPTVAPSPTAAPVEWSRASLREDWPAPVRGEAAGRPVVVPIRLKVVQGQEGNSLEAGRYQDPSGDTGSTVYPWLDIHEIRFCGRACVLINVGVPPAASPAKQWIAYGLVVDDDGDGVPDRRMGIDNIPVRANGERQHRAWITDLHSGRTVAAVGEPYGFVGKTFVDTFFPGEAGPIARFSFGGDIAGGGTFGAVPARFYAWASVIADGRVVATDYAPDVGWLHPSPTAKP